MSLSAVNGQPHVQLDSFTTRVVQGEKSVRPHLYVTEWQALDQMDAAGQPRIICLSNATLFERKGHHSRLRRVPPGPVGKYHVLVAACHQEQSALNPLCELEATLKCVQAQAEASTLAATVSILTDGAQVERSERAGVWGLARCVRTEADYISLQCIDTPKRESLAWITSLTEPEAMLYRDGLSAPRLKSAAQTLLSSTNGRAEMNGVPGAHVITGGTGGLGLLTARWLAQHGLRKLGLASRSGVISRDVASEHEKLQATGVATLADKCDSAEPMDVIRFLYQVFERAGSAETAVGAVVLQAVATRGAPCAHLPLCAVEAALVLVQIQATSNTAPPAWLVTEGAHHRARLPEHAGPWGLARSARVEASSLLVCIDAAPASALACGSPLTEPEVVLGLQDPLHGHHLRFISASYSAYPPPLPLHFHSPSPGQTHGSRQSFDAFMKPLHLRGGGSSNETVRTDRSSRSTEAITRDVKKYHPTRLRRHCGATRLYKISSPSQSRKIANLAQQSVSPWFCAVDMPQRWRSSGALDVIC